MTRNNVVVSLWDNDELANRIAQIVSQQEMSEVMQPRSYRNEEFNPTFQQINAADLSLGFAANDKHVFIVATSNPIEGYSPQEVYARSVLAAKAAKDNGAVEVTVVMPDLLYGRSDRSATDDPEWMGGKAFSLEALAESFAWHVDHVLTLHPHSKDTQEIFERIYSKFRGNKVEKGSVVYQLSPSPVIAHYLISQGIIDPEQNGANAVLLVPDGGATALNDHLYSMLNLDGLKMAYADKTRTKPNDPNCVFVELDEDEEVFAENNVIFVDDGIDTAGTLTANFAHVPQARQRIAYASHVWLAGNRPNPDAQNRLLDSNVDLFIFGNTHPDRIYTLRRDLVNRRIVFIDYAKYFADAITECVAKGVTPEQRYRFSSVDDIMRSAGSLYDVVDQRINP